MDENKDQQPTKIYHCLECGYTEDAGKFMPKLEEGNTDLVVCPKCDGVEYKTKYIPLNLLIEMRVYNLWDFINNEEEKYE